MSTAAELVQKYAVFEYILLGDLRDLLEDPISGTSRKWLLAVLDALTQTLPVELELQQADEGYLSPVLERFPNWSPQVLGLHRARRNLSLQLVALRDRVENHEPLADVVRALRHDLRDWMLCYRAQCRREARMLQVAMTLDVGSGD